MFKEPLPNVDVIKYSHPSGPILKMALLKALIRVRQLREWCKPMWTPQYDQLVECELTIAVELRRMGVTITTT